MTDLLSHLLDAPVANILILAGLVFLAIGVLGKVSGKIEPSTRGRIMSGLLGMGLLIYGLHAHTAADSARPEGERTAEKSTAHGQPSEKPVERASDGRFSGAWKNDNPQTRGITRLEVQQNGDQVAVHAWAACSPRDCDWGTTKGVVSGASASVTWDQGFVMRNMKLFSDAGRLRMVLDSVYRDKRAPQHEVEYFVKSP